MSTNRVVKLFKIKYPIVQAGMVWTSGWKLAAAVSNAGGLGLIGTGSMHPPVLQHHIQKCRAATNNSFGVNMPLLHPEIKEQIEIVIKEKVPIVFTSAGNPKTWTKLLKSEGITVVHVIASTTFAQKAEDAGCDAVVAEGFEAGGHNGIQETTTLVLVPSIVDMIKIPVIAAGGISDGRSMAAMMMLGAEGVQVGSRFVCSEEASCHPSFKEEVIKAKEGDTKLMMKSLMPVRLLKNDFYQQVQALEEQGGSRDDFKALLGRGRSKKGMFEGQLAEGELEIGQVSSRISKILPAGKIVEEIWQDYQQCMQRKYYV